MMLLLAASARPINARFRVRLPLAVALITALASLLVACGPSTTDSDPTRQALIASPPGPLQASVNGEAISEPLLATYARGRGLDPADPAQRQTALDALVESILLAQEALTSGAANSSEAQADAALLRVQYLASRALTSYQEKIDISDVKVLEYYQQESVRAGAMEWRLEHILFDDEATARAVAERASAPGADFAALMAEYAGVARQSKSLDWANPARLPAELAEVAAELPDGMVAPAPVKTAYGWHVLHRVESRPFSAPDFNTVKEAARQQLIASALKDYVAGLRTKADVATGASAPASGK